MWKRILRPVILLVIGLPVAVWALHPWPVLLRWSDPDKTAYMAHRASVARSAGEPIEIRHRWVPLDSISPQLRRAVTLAEDDRFFEHGGVDWAALAEEVRYRGEIPPRIADAGDREALRVAWAYARENRERVRGRSTITQQVARNLYLSPDRSLVRKVQELLIARRLEFFLPKDRILEIYLNVAELGPGVFGVEAASRFHFDRPAAELTSFQAASLAATLPHPLTSNPSHNPGRMAWRRDLILGRLAGGAIPVPPPEPDPIDLAIPDPVIEPPEFEPVPAPDLPPPRDTLRGDTLQADTLRGDTIRADTLRSDTLRPSPRASDGVGQEPLLPPRPER